MWFISHQFWLNKTQFQIPKMPPTPEEKQNVSQTIVKKQQFCEGEDAVKLLEQCKEE